MTKTFIIIACLFVILAGIKASASLVVPFLLALFLAILLTPPFAALKNRRLHSGIALALMCLGVGLLAVLTVTVLKTSLDEFTANLPVYQSNLMLQLDSAFQWVEELGVEAPKTLVAEHFDPRFALNYAGAIARSLSGMMGQMTLIFLVVAFMLVEASVIKNKIHNMKGVHKDKISAIEKNLQDVRHYVSLKSITSLATGVSIGLMLWFFEVDNALFMGLLAFFLNYVPTIGSIIAGIPGVLLAFVLLGPGMAGVILVGYVVINVTISNIIEPKFMGHGLGLSPLMIVLSMILWGWLLGPVGMLLSIPLTMTVKVGLESSEKTRMIATFLGTSKHSLAPPKKITPK